MALLSTRTHSIIYDTYINNNRIIPTHSHIHMHAYLLQFYIKFINNMYEFHVEVTTRPECDCRCGPISAVGEDEVVEKLLKYNSSLTKYLGKYQPEATQSSQTVPQQMEEQMEGRKFERSIVEERNLNFLLPQHNKPRQTQITKTQPNNHKPQQLTTEYKHQQQQTMQIKQVRSGKKQPKMSGKQAALNAHFKDMSQSSRYLSDTGFRKYFQRQCFQNYGHKNTTGVADGIVYGNYMKTHNINPHTGYNMPINEQTFRHALTSASPEKFKEYEGYEGRQKRINEGKPIEKDPNQLQQILEGSHIKSEINKKYRSLKLKQPQNPPEEYISSRKQVIEMQKPSRAKNQKQEKIKISEEQKDRIMEKSPRNIQLKQSTKGEDRMQYSPRSPPPQPYEPNNNSEERFRNDQKRKISIQRQSARNKQHIYHPPIIIDQSEDACPRSIKQYIIRKGFTDPYIADQVFSTTNCRKYQEFVLR